MSATERRPSFPFYGREFYSSPRIRCLTAAQRAVWLALAWRCWEEGMLEDGTAMLELTAASEGVSVEDVRRVLTLCFELKEGSWRNPKLEEIRSELDAFRAAQAARGLKGADARWRKHGDAMAPPSTSNGNPMAVDGSVSVSVSGSVSDLRTPLPPVGEVTPKPSKPKPEYPSEPTDPRALQAYRDWKEYKRAKFTPIVARKTVRLLEVWGVDRFVAAVDYSITNTYAGLFEPPRVNGRVNGKPWDERRALERLRSDDPRIVALGEEELRAHGIDPAGYRAVRA